MSADHGLRAAVRARLAAYASQRVVKELDDARAELASVRAELAAEHAEAQRLSFMAARLDADLVKAQGTAERLQHDLRAAEADVQRLTAELSTRPAAGGEDGYWKRKWLEDRRALTALHNGAGRPS